MTNLSIVQIIFLEKMEYIDEDNTDNIDFAVRWNSTIFPQLFIIGFRCGEMGCKSVTLTVPRA